MTKRVVEAHWRVIAGRDDIPVTNVVLGDIENHRRFQLKAN